MARTWDRAIALVDMNAFFAAIEQQDFPEYRGRPVVITNGLRGTCVITCSYEARSFGICTGTRLPKAKALCPDVVRLPARPHRYAEVSSRIMAALAEAISPDIEVYSVDEAFLDVTHCQRLLGDPETIGRRIKQAVFDASGLLCSVGVSGDVTTAKFAAKQRKPDGLTVIPPWEAAEQLHDVPVTELCGIARGIGGFLERHGVRTCGDMKKLPISVLGRRFGNPGRRIWHMCQGTDPTKLTYEVPAPKSVGHGKVLPPATRDRELLLTWLLHMATKVGTRLRRHELEAGRFFVGLRTDLGWIGGKPRLPLPTADGGVIFALCRRVLDEAWDGEGIHQVQVTALDPRSTSQQIEMFAPNLDRHACGSDFSPTWGGLWNPPARPPIRPDHPAIHRRIDSLGLKPDPQVPTGTSQPIGSTMCLEAIYDVDGLPRARLPVRRRGGGLLLLPWGRRPRQRGALPDGGWARLESIRAGEWDRWFPRPVKLLLQRFAERDHLGEVRWYEVTRGHWVQGLLAREGEERRVYVVTLAPTRLDATCDRWPRILSG
jgi:DNA polymerase-4